MVSIRTTRSNYENHQQLRANRCQLKALRRHHERRNISHSRRIPGPDDQSGRSADLSNRGLRIDDAQHGADLFNLAVPGKIYTRIANPTQDVLEQRLAALEGGIAALVTSAGSAAITYAVPDHCRSRSQHRLGAVALRRYGDAVHPHAAQTRHRRAFAADDSPERSRR